MVVFKRHLPSDNNVVSLHVTLNRVWDAIEAVGKQTSSTSTTIPILGGAPISSGGGGSITVVPPHNSLSGLQGGSAGNYWHLTKDEHDSLVGLVDASVTLGATFATNQSYRVVGGVAMPVTSLDVGAPFVDGIVLESGSAGDVRPVASISQETYSTPLALPTGTLYFLGQDGKLTSTVPTIVAGDIWLVILARKVDSTHFIFTPTQPLAL